MPSLSTVRLTLAPVTVDDAPFILALLNDPTWLRFIGDRGVRTLDQARHYIEHGSIRSFARHGFGSFVVRRTADGAPVGACGLYQRDYLPGPDVGFAFFPGFTRQGYAFEAASAVLAHGRADLGLTRILAICSPDNVASIALLTKLGLRFDRSIRIADGSEELSLFTTDAPSRP